MKLTRFLGFGVNVGVIPTVQLSLYGKATLSYREYDAYGRLYPFGGSFFVGAGVGYATTRGSFSDTVDIPVIAGVTTAPQQVGVRTEGAVRSMILTPQIGFLHTSKWGPSIGLDVGAQVPIAPSQLSYTTTLSPGVPESFGASTTDAVRETLEKIGKQVVPTVNLRVGWLL